MIYGPFDLSNAKSADVAFMLWRHIEVSYDHAFFGISGDNATYNGWSWDGSADWESKTFSLNPYIGDNSVWIGWHFTSDGSVQYEGPWIDDIMLKFEPGDVTIQGNFTYADRLNTMRGAVGTKVQLWDADSSGDDWLAEIIITENSGNFSFPAQMNWDLDDSDPNLSNRRLDLYLVWVLENSNFKVTNSNVVPVPYTWGSLTYSNIGLGTTTITGSLPDGIQNLQAMWIFQDIRRTREYYLNNTSPQSDPQFIAAHWVANQTSEDFIEGSHFWAAIDPHVFIADNSSTRSVDTVVHELGHHIMWNQTRQWLWYEFNCFDHDIFSQESVQCAWSEGWADFFAVAVNGDVCYDKGVGPCTGNADQDKYDLENHTRNDPLNNPITGLPWWGDGVEGRVAGSLYDLMDPGNEAPWYDNASWGFDPIVDIALTGSGKSSLHEFWNGYQGSDKHNGVRSIFQNTIDYDQAPVFAAIPGQNTLQNFPHSHIIDLWDFSSDAESPDASLTYQIVNVSDSRCGISLDSHWVNANPQMNWTGSCYVTVSVNDTIPNKTATGGFWLNVLQINSRNYLPIAMKQ